VKIWPISTVAAAAVLQLGGVAGARPDPVRIGVVLNALDNQFFVEIFEGVRAEASQLGARASVRAPRNNSNLGAQAALVRALVAGKNDCYAVAPIGATNLVRALRGAKGPIVVVNSAIDPAAARAAGVRPRSSIGTDDFAAGKLAGTAMASILHRGGDVALFGGVAGNLNNRLRLRGFERGIRGTGLRVVARVNADWRRENAELAAERILRAHPRLSGIFAANDLMALGASDAIRAAGRSGEIKIIGLDGIPDALDAVRAGSMSATVSQYPYLMGLMAVEACVAAVRGATLPVKVDAPIALVTEANVARATALFPQPFHGYSDPFKRLLRKLKAKG
jgi:ABC-type sugar transport system substrate-binding protein